jgi:hypothetical protein
MNLCQPESSPSSEWAEARNVGKTEGITQKEREKQLGGTCMDMAVMWKPSSNTEHRG